MPETTTTQSSPTDLRQRAAIVGVRERRRTDVLSLRTEVAEAIAAVGWRRARPIVQDRVRCGARERTTPCPVGERRRASGGSHPGRPGRTPRRATPGGPAAEPGAVSRALSLPIDSEEADEQ